MAPTHDVYMALILSLLSGMRHREAAETLTGERSSLLGLHKEPESANPQHSNTAVLNWHTGMFSGWCQDPLSHLTIFFILISGKAGEFQVIKVIWPHEEKN